MGGFDFSLFCSHGARVGGGGSYWSQVTPLQNAVDLHIRIIPPNSEDGTGLLQPRKSPATWERAELPFGLLGAAGKVAGLQPQPLGPFAHFDSLRPTHSLPLPICDRLWVHLKGDFCPVCSRASPDLWARNLGGWQCLTLRKGFQGEESRREGAKTHLCRLCPRSTGVSSWIFGSNAQDVFLISQGPPARQDLREQRGSILQAGNGVGICERPFSTSSPSIHHLTLPVLFPGDPGHRASPGLLQ